MIRVSEQDRIALEIARTVDGPDPFAAALRATRMPMVIADPNQPDMPVVFVNTAFERATGFSREEVLGRNCRFLQGPLTDPADVARIREAIAKGVPIEIDLLNHRKNGDVFWNRLLIAPVFDSNRRVAYFFASQLDVTLERDRLVRLQEDRDALETEVERRRQELRRSETNLRFALSAGRLGSWTLDLVDMTLETSDHFRMNFGRDADEPLSYDELLATIHSGDRERMLAEVRRCIERNVDYDIEYRVIAPSGDLRWVHIRGQTFYRADGTPLSMAGISLDITERKHAEEYRSLLAGELTHRVKNTLTLIQSIIRQTLRTAPSLEEAGQTLEARVVSLAAANDVLTEEAWDSASIADIADRALTPFQSEGRERVDLHGGEIRLPPRGALALAMALHELATNAVKYGALSNDTGRVRLCWSLLDGTAPHDFRVTWQELGGPPVAVPTRTGFGSRLIERALAQEIDGTATISYRPEGILFVAEGILPGRLQD
ncbi:HWE histidine kinase domain-containing protein [Methylobacterium sp. Leaf85]|uniref:HWE histidine kinase domain-containing protein n=1 Tax=Methylobacterium sp. Leaf85 TaxID=1736241 RepID=UPI0006F923CA|nr:HWE histidine kinase domain-containing protein [Methylobacterium sp. Leaf85]KQO41200.1 histidine kinase [Methylobacterium sp. Leaf85]